MRSRKGGSRILLFQILTIFLGIILLLISHKVWSLDPGKDICHFHLDTWKTEQGLPENTVICIVQTTDGYIWLGTSNGLARFDGARFKIFNAKNTSELQNSFIRSLYEDREGTLWIGTEGGLTKYKEGTFTTYTPRDVLQHIIVRCLYQDSKRNLWIGTYGGGLIRFRDGQFTNFTTKEGLSNNIITSILEDSNGNLRIGTRNGLNNFVDGAFKVFTTQNGLLSNYITFIFEDREKNLWIGTSDGLNKLKDGKCESYTTRDGLSHEMITNILMDRAGNLWIGTDGGGLNRMKNGKFTSFTTKDGLSCNHVFAILEDREGSLWIGTVEGGVNRLRDVSLTTYTAREGLDDNMVRCVREDSSGRLWIGTNNGLSLLDKGKYTIDTFHTVSSGNYIGSLFEDRSGNLWVGTRNGLYHWREGIFSLFAQTKEWTGTIISSIIVDIEGNLWVGTLGRGLHRFKDNNWNVYTTQNGLSHNQVTCIHEDSKGNLWIGTKNGLNYLEKGTFTHYTVDDTLPYNEINCIYEDEGGTLWIGTRNGPSRFKHGIFSPYSNGHEAFLNNGIFSILEDNNRYLWMSSNKGIFRVAKKELNDFADADINDDAEDKIGTIHILAFDHSDGMKSRICNGLTQPAGWKSKDGKLWFPTIKGVVSVDPQNLKKNTIIPPVVIEEIIVDGEEYDVFSRPTQEKVVFSPGMKKFEFHYTALSFLRPEKVCFKYRLEGYDEEWVDAGARRTAYYTSLPPGEYTFRVIACNNDGKWNSDGASFHFYRKSYFYQTIWFYLLCAIAIATVGIGFYTERFRKLKKREEELEALVAKRTRQLKIANRKLSETNLELKKLASLDGLTGIYNSRWFGEFLELEWKRATRLRKPITIILIDVDFFKLYNDTYGHQAGDECLKRIAQKLKMDCRRPGDVVARYGGEEFIVLLSDTPSNEAAAVAERLWKGIFDLKIPHKTSSVEKYVTISLGCATGVPRPGDDPLWLVKTADGALYQSKRDGRNCITFRTP
jgi:diguanylate cyclase (GGDEF)-like protein